MEIEETNVTMVTTPESPQATGELIIRALTFYVAPVISIVGILGNSVAIVAMTSMPTTSWLLYILGWNIAQTIHLLSLLDTWASNIGFGIYAVIGGWCQLVTFLSRASDFLVLWYAVLFGLDLWVRTHVRGKYADYFCSASFARLLIISFNIIAIIVYVNVSIAFGEYYVPNRSAPICVEIPGFNDVLRRLKIADAFFDSFIPLASLSFCVVSIALTTDLNCQTPTLSSCDTNATRRRDKMEGREIESIFMKNDGNRCALVMLSAFLIFNLPVHLFSDFLAIKSLIGGGIMTLDNFLTQQALLQLKHVNQASTFVLLLASSALFRKSLRSLWNRSRRRKTEKNISCHEQMNDFIA